MLHQHVQSKDNKVMLYEIKKLDNGNIYLRGCAKGIQVNDEFYTWTTGMTYKCVKLISLTDSKGKWTNPDDGKNALFEGEFSLKN